MELISRDEVLNILNDICNHALKVYDKKYHLPIRTITSTATKNIKRLPTVESRPTVEVIRCKDCFHGREIDGEWVCMFRGELVKADGYCHKAELRGEIDGSDKQRRVNKQDKCLHDNDSRCNDGSEIN